MMNKWELFILVTCSCLIGIALWFLLCNHRSMSVREQAVKAEQTESSVSVYPTPKEAITIEGTHVLIIGYPNVEQGSTL